MTRERGQDPRESMTREQLSILRQMAQGASRSEVAATLGVSQERVKGLERASWFGEALAREKESPWTDGERLAAGMREGSLEKQGNVPVSRSARRALAIDLLAAGVSITETASLVDYTRPHLSHLANHDREFIAELKRRSAENQERRPDRLWHLWDRAASVVETALDEGDPRTALEVLKLGARGVTDVQHDWLAVRAESRPEEATDFDSVILLAEDSLQTGTTCRDCGLVAKTAGGLKQHRNARHGGEAGH